MSNTKETWEEVLSKIEGLGLKLKYHLESETAEGDDSSDTSDDESVAEKLADDAADAADGDASTKSDFAPLIDGVEKFVDMIDDAFDAFGSASKDAAVRSDLRDIGESLRNALAATWNDAGADLREVLTRPKRPSSDDPIDTIGEIIDPDAPPAAE